MRSLGRLTVDLVARIGGFQQGMDQAARVAEQRSQEMQRSLRALQRVGAGLLATFGGFSAVQIGRQMLDTARSIEEASRTAGIGTETLQRLRSAFDDLGGLGASTVDMSLQRFNRRIGLAIQNGGPAVASLRRLGIEIRDVAGAARDTELVLRDAMVALAGITSDSERAAEASQLFGQEAGPKLAAALGQGIEAFDKAAESAGGLLNESNIRLATELSKALRGIAGDVAGSLNNAILEAGYGFAQATGLALMLDESARKRIKVLQDIEHTQERIKMLEGAGPIRFFIEGGDDALEHSRRRLDELQESLRSLSAEAAKTFEGLEEDIADLPAVDKFAELAARLEQQIALFGNVGEAAKVAYQMQIGALDELSDAEQARLLDLASQLDGLNAVAAATKEFESAQSRLSQMRNTEIERQLSLTRELTEFEKLHLQIQRGALPEVTALQLQSLEALAQEVDMTREKTKLYEEVRSVTEAMLTPLEQYERTIENLNRLRADSIELLGEQALSEETYLRAVEAAQDAFEAATQSAEAASNMIGESLGRGLQDTLVGYFMGIETNFADMLRRMALQATTSQLFAALGALGGPAGSVFSFLGFGGGRATGGPVSPGKAYLVGERGPELFAPGVPGSIIPSVGGGDITVNVVNNTGVAADAQVRQSGPGMVDIILNVAGSGLAEGKLDSVMAGRFGIRPTTGLR